MVNKVGEVLGRLRSNDCINHFRVSESLGWSLGWRRRQSWEPGCRLCNLLSLAFGLGLGLGFILDGNRFGAVGAVGVFSRRQLRRTKLELLLGLGSSVKLLIDGKIIRIEYDVGGSRVGITLESGRSPKGDLQEPTKLSNVC